MAAKIKFVCNACGYESQKWFGRCPSCSAWNTFEELEIPAKKTSFRSSGPPEEIILEKVSLIKPSAKIRLSSGFEEFDRVLGGGIVAGSVVLLSGDPGIGKSTLLLQLALYISQRNGKSEKSVLYVSGEESAEQVRLRAGRLTDPDSLREASLYIASVTDIDSVIENVSSEKRALVVIDSVQTMQSSEVPGFPGSIPQIRYACSRLITFAKRNNTPVFLIGHVTKEGIVAGPMLLSHMVDTVLYLEGERFSGTRILRAFKNRFGNSEEVGIFVMEEKGLVQIKDAAAFFLGKKNTNVPGSSTAVIMEGTRPILLEIQALVVPTTLSFPRRVATGLSERRLELLLAVIQKSLKIPVDRMDVFVNIVGGVKVLEPAVDLALCLAVLSSYRNKPLPHAAAISEVGLLGELRNVVQLDKRISEARKFGFKQIFTHRQFANLGEVSRAIV